MESIRQAADSLRFAQERSAGSAMTGPRFAIGGSPEFDRAVQDAPIFTEQTAPLQNETTGQDFFVLDVDSLDDGAGLA